VASGTTTTILFYGAAAFVFGLLCRLYWKHDDLFQRFYTKRNISLDSKSPAGITFKQMHRVFASIFGVLAVLFVLSGVIALIAAPNGN
jgi:hypothetical protein